MYSGGFPFDVRPETDYRFNGFTHYIQAIAEMVPSNRPRLLPFSIILLDIK